MLNFYLRYCVISLFLISQAVVAAKIPEADLKELIREASEALRRLEGFQLKINSRSKDEEPIFTHADQFKVKNLASNIGKGGTTKMVLSSFSSSEMSLLTTSNDPISAGVAAMGSGSAITFYFPSLQEIQESLKYFSENTVSSIQTTIEDLLDTYGNDENPDLFYVFSNFSSLTNSVSPESVCQALGVATVDNLQAQIGGFKAYLNLVVSKAKHSMQNPVCKQQAS